MVRVLRQAGAWVAYRLIRAYWWIRRPVVLGVRVLVADGDRVLLVQHSYRDGWFLPGGTPESGESLAQAARREAREETGVSVGEVTLLGIYSSLAGPESDHVVIFVGEASCSDKHQTRTGKNAEVEATQWIVAARPPRTTAEQTRSILQDWERGWTSSTYRVVD